LFEVIIAIVIFRFLISCVQPYYQNLNNRYTTIYVNKPEEVAIYRFLTRRLPAGSGDAYNTYYVTHWLIQDRLEPYVAGLSATGFVLPVGVTYDL
jgi:hypothetical protein